MRAWFKSFLSGPAGEGSSKRLKSFIFCVLICFMVARGTVNTKIHLYAMYALLVTILLLDAVITVQDVINIRNGKRQESDTIKEGDKIQITKTD